ncbi:MAG TPA: hypothetical protein VM845_10125 [Burkholderiaceae bacterium]|nr:hypothetical protein [Burkholderiaceae bacterium]
MSTAAHARTTYRRRQVDVSVSALDAGSYLVIVVHDPSARVPDQLMEYIVDVQPLDAAAGLGIAYARDFIDGQLH